MLPREHNSPAASAPVAMLLCTAAVLMACFYEIEHDWATSLRELFSAEIEQMESWAGGGSTTRQAAFLALALLGIVGFCTPRLQLPRGFDALGLALLAYLAWSAASIAWSVDAGMSLRRLLTFAFWLLAALGIARQFDIRLIALLGVIIPAAYALFGLFAELSLGTFTPFAADYRFAGTLHPNGQGTMLAMFCLACVTLAWTEPLYRRLFLALLAAGLTLLLLTKSRSACGAMVVALAALWLCRPGQKCSTKAALGGAWAISAGLLLLLLSGIDLEQKLADTVFIGRQEEAMSLTGRVPLWAELMEYVKERPLTGFGYESFWIPEHIYAVSEEVEWGVTETHSAYLGVLLDLGLVGLALAAAAIGVGLYHALASYRWLDPAFGFALAMGVLCLANGLTESSLAWPTFVSLIAAACLLRAAWFEKPAGAMAISRANGNRSAALSGPDSAFST